MAKRNIAIVLIALAACLMVFAGCAGRGTLSSTIDDSTGTYVVTADDAGKGSGVASFGGDIKVAEGQSVVASADLEKGSLQLRLLDENGEVVIDETTSGQATYTHELKPGDYSIGVSCNEDGTTGTLKVIAQ